MLAEPGRSESESSDFGASGGAVIIPFPSGDQMRLRRALAALDTAMNEQRQAVAEWRAALGELSAAVSGLGGALVEQDRALGTLAGDVAALNGEATRLVVWSDAVLNTPA